MNEESMKTVREIYNEIPRRHSFQQAFAVVLFFFTIIIIDYHAPFSTKGRAEREKHPRVLSYRKP